MQDNANKMKNKSQFKPIDAATVILTRDQEGGPFEVFIMRRNKKQDFMGGAFVFPGGQLDDADCDPHLAGCAQGLSVEEAKLGLNEPDLPNHKAIGLFFAAVRETFEEAGMLLAAHQSGAEVDFSDSEIHERFQASRRELHGGKISLKELAERENIQFTLGLIRPYAHWITPDGQPKRFDTRFLLARLPKGQIPVHDSIEMIESLWITTKDALSESEAGKILLMPPTLKIMEELSEFSSVDELFEVAASREIHSILPQPFSEGDTFGLKLPHDSEYSIEEFKQPHRPYETSRIVMIDGRWKTVKSEEQ